MSLVYYYAPMSSASRTTWAIDELGVECERVLVDFRKGETSAPGFVAKNPNAKVPFLVADGVPIFESLAILLYLGETFGVEKKLFPPPGLERAEVFKWMAWATATLLDALQRMLRSTSPTIPEDQRNAAAGDVGKKELSAALTILDEALEGRDYLVGDAFSFADLAVAGYVPYLRYLGFELTPWKNVAVWSERCLSRPANHRVD